MNDPVPYAASRYKDLLPEVPKIVLTDEAGPSRLTVCLPHLHGDFVFGGLASVLELARHLSRHYESVRFASLAPLPGEGQRIDVRAWDASRAGIPPEVCATAGGGPVAFHRRDVLLCSYWPSVGIWEKLAELATGQGLTPNRFYYCIQDFEPGFYPMGAKYLLAEATYRHGDACVAVINSRELAGYFAAHGYRFPEAVVVKPSLNRFLAGVLDELRWTVPAKATGCCRVLVYGRPEQPRNCFPALCAGLAKYAQHAHRPGDDVTFYSAGIAHEDLDFGHGLVLRSLGTLSLPNYAAVLVQSHVGLALMASPHPSYPPLEMACFGLEVLTNACGGKDLAATHPNIHSVPVPSPEAIAEALPRCIDTARRRAGRPTPAVLPACLESEPWPKNFRHARIPIITV